MKVGMDTTTDTRQKVHALVDDLRPEQLPAVLSMIEEVLEEPLTPEDCAALDRAEEWFKHHEGIAHEEVLAEFGLTMDDFPLRKNGS
jgi:hypothetical protein